MSIWLRIGGYPATEIAAHTPVTWETWADGGSGVASWALAISARSQHQALRVQRSLVEVMCGPMPVFTGILTDYDRSTGECSAFGLSSAARKYLALDGPGSNTRDLFVAISTARFHGWQATNPDTVGGFASGDPIGNPIDLGTLMDQRASELGLRWGVDASGRVFLRADPTTPSWLASPDSAAFGTTDEDQATLLYGRYLDLTTNTNLTAVAGSGAPQADVDLTERGAMTNAGAVGILDSMLARDRSRTAWTNGVTLTRDQIQTMGGTPAFLPAVRGGQMMRSFGLSYGAQSLALDTVIGKTRYTQGDDVIYVEPVNTAPRTYVDVQAAS